jgi:hypothetical protein
VVTQAVLDQARIPSRFLPGLVAGLASGLLIAFVVFGIGSSRPDAEVLTGHAQTGYHMASIESGGSYYGVNESVAWIDASGSFHEDGWPACLRPMGTTRTVRFGAAHVTIPDGVGFRPVLWVDCRLV